VKKDMRALLAQAEDAGCEVKPTRNGHVQIKVPGGGIVIAASTASDHRTIKNTRAELRRAGLELPHA
jgi:hypothetical protein